MLSYHLKNSFGIHKSIVIPETQYSLSFVFKPVTSFPVIFLYCRLSMLTTIKLNNDLSFKAYEIYNIVPQRMLTPELETIQTLRPYMRPQNSLSIRRTVSEVFSIRNQPFSHLMSTLSLPSPLKGEDN